MPAAAVIPAPIAYIKVVAVKKLVVGCQFDNHGPPVGGFPWLSTVLTLIRMMLLNECHEFTLRLL